MKSQKWRRFSESLADGERFHENVAIVCYRTERIPVLVPIRRQYGLWRKVWLGHFPGNQNRLQIKSI